MSDSTKRVLFGNSNTNINLKINVHATLQFIDKSIDNSKKNENQVQKSINSIEKITSSPKNISSKFNKNFLKITIIYLIQILILKINHQLLQKLKDLFLLLQIIKKIEMLLLLLNIGNFYKNLYRKKILKKFLLIKKIFLLKKKKKMNIL